MKSPIIIGAVGGSGTRVVRGIVEGCGVFMGRRINRAGDALDFEEFLDDWINPILSYTRSVDYTQEDLPVEIGDKALAKLRAIAMNYFDDVPKAASGIGWKCPRNIYILPLIKAIYPNLRFLHVIRDGRDMALSTNQNQRSKHYLQLFGCGYESDVEVASIRLWSKVNIEAADWATRNLGGNYRVIRFEYLCTNPLDWIHELLTWLDYSHNDPPSLARLISPPDSLYRFRLLKQERLSMIESAGMSGLRRFGYIK